MLATHREHEEGVKYESHGREGLDGGHHVPLQTQREDNEQRHSDQQQHAETEGHLWKVSRDRTTSLLKNFKMFWRLNSKMLENAGDSIGN